MQLELSPQERDVLEKIVERAHSEMRVELRRTTTPDYHDALQAEEKQVEDLLARIRALAS
ncbi:MAG: hypothetical protein R3263_08895 [Myxococcota bacterium]|nr:hypothetical protein [Myxococcota bacterium]